MQNPIPPGMRSYPKGVESGAKKLKLPPGTNVPNPKGHLDSVEGLTRLNPSGKNLFAPGNMSISTSDETNTTVSIKIAIINTEFPQHNQLVDQIPKGAMLFVRPPRDRTQREQMKNEANGLIAYSDQFECCTPEQTNLQVHFEAINNKLRGGQPLSLLQAVKTWKPWGVMQSSAIDPSFRVGPSLIRQGNIRWVNTLPTAEFHCVNYWGPTPCGFHKSHLHWLWIEEDIRSETMYNVGIYSQNPFVQYMSNIPNDKEGMDKWFEEAWNNLSEPEKNAYQISKAKLRKAYDEVRYVPKVVPISSDNRYLTDQEREYTVTGANGKPETRHGYPIYFGKVRHNKKFLDDSLSHENRRVLTDTRNMIKSYGEGKNWIDVLVDIDDRYNY